MKDRRTFIKSAALLAGTAATLTPPRLYAAKPKITWRMQTYAGPALADSRAASG